MLGRTVLIAGAIVLLALAAPAVNAEQLLSSQQYQMSGKNIVVNIIAVNVADYPASNIMPQPGMKYYQIIYNFTNIGDTEDKGFVQPILVDVNGTQYRDMGEYTSWSVLPGHTSNNSFTEIPVPDEATITKVIFIEGFEQHEFDLPAPSSSQVPSGQPSSSPSPTPGSGYSWNGCLPLIPFGLVIGFAGVGLVINRCRVIKR